MLSATEDSVLSIPAPALNRSLIVECVDRTHATMYLGRALTATDAHELRHLTEGLPPSIHVLRVQLRAIDANQHTMNALREIVRAWRARGNVHLVFISAVARSAERPRIETPDVVRLPATRDDADWGSPAHTAAFL